jgi:release factor glutamine methyltransferase
MKSLLDILKLSTDFLNEKGIKHPRREAQDLICDALNIKRMQLYLEHDRPLMESELQMLREKLSRRAKGEPTAYIHGKVAFLNCSLKVTPAVLIPRQETEILTDKIIKSLENEDLTDKSFWDLCCGSGCIGIAIKKRFPELKVVLSDISPKALAIAQENAKQNGVEITCLEGDLLTPFNGEKTHFLVCNPPYISQQEFTQLETEVRNHEPSEALIGGESGLEFYQRLAENLEHFLYREGKVWFEIGAGQGKSLEALFQGKQWKTCRLELDWSGKDRFFFLEIE